MSLQRAGATSLPRGSSVGGASCRIAHRRNVIRPPHSGGVSSTSKRQLGPCCDSRQSEAGVRLMSCSQSRHRSYRVRFGRVANSGGALRSPACFGRVDRVRPHITDDSSANRAGPPRAYPLCSARPAPGPEGHLRLFPLSIAEASWRRQCRCAKLPDIQGFAQHWLRVAVAF